MPKSLKEQILNKCRHFNGTMCETCDAGVSYDAVKVAREPGKGFSLPCLRDRCEGTTCEKVDFPTEAEADAEIAEWNKQFQGATTARAAIVAHLGGSWKRGMESRSGAIDCPICRKAKLHYLRAGTNGHIRAQCETKDCVAWME